jgi:DNA-binding transcriptional LysR family regulator
MDWRDLHVLAILNSEGSLAGAARALGVNHATISRRIASLEADVGEPLVRRLARSTPLTEKGRELAAIATEMLTSAQRIERLVKATGSSLSGTVRLTAPPVFVSETLIPTLPSFLRLHPHLRLILSSDAQIASLDAGEADLAVRLVQPTGRQHIVRRLGEITYGLFASADHAALPSEDWRFIGFDGKLARTPQQVWLEDYAAGRPFSVLTGDLYGQRAAAESGLGVALLPDGTDAFVSKLVSVSTDRPPPRSAWMVVHADLRTSLAVRAVAEHIVGLFHQMPGLNT